MVTSPNRFLRALILAPVLILLTLLAGCFKADVSIEIAENDTLSGTITVGVSNEHATRAKAHEDAAYAALLEALPKETTVIPWSDGDYVGKRLRFTAVPISEAAEGATVRHVGRSYVFSGDIDLTSLDAVAVEPDLKIVVTFPGNVTKSNGTVDGRTVTWRPTIGQKNQMTATADDSPVSTSNGALGALGGILAAIGSVGLVAWLATRRHQTPGLIDDAPARPKHETPTAAVAVEASFDPTTSTPMIPAGWYPTANGQYLRWHDGAQWTTHLRPMPGLPHSL